MSYAQIPEDGLWTLDFVHLQFENDIFWRKKREAWIKLEGGLNKL